MIEAELAFTQSLNDLMTVSLSLRQYHSHRIDRYLDTRRPIATAANCVATSARTFGYLNTRVPDGY